MDASMDAMIALEDVHLKLASQAGEVNILRGVDLVIRTGETVGLVGPSGSGKSTMMMVVAGLERPTRGVVRVAGRDLGGLDEDGLALFRRDHVGIVFQAFHLVPTMTAIENVAVPMELAGEPGAFPRARELLAAVGLGHRLDHYPAQLSGGEQQRVAIARAVALRPPLLLADEPTGNLDSATGAQIIDLLLGLQRESRRTLVLVTHDPALAQHADRVITLRDGRIVSACPAARVAPA